LVIHESSQFSELAFLPASVVKVMIEDYTESTLPLPRFPPQIKTIKLIRVSGDMTIVFPEGLEKIQLHEMSLDADANKWVFPSTLEKVKVRDSVGDWIDLSAVTAPAIKMASVTSELESISFPDSLDRLSLTGDMYDGQVELIFPLTTDDWQWYRAAAWQKAFDAYDEDGEEYHSPWDYPSLLILLPPQLRSLHLSSFVGIEDIQRPATIYLTEVHLKEIESLPPLEKLFPAVETLTLEGMALFPKLELLRLRSLVLIDCYSELSLTLACPELESLTISNDTTVTRLYLIDEDTGLGATLVTLNLTRVEGFPAAVEWERLESVTIEDSERIDLPFIRWLSELELDRPTLTNGVMVSNLEEYRMAWGMKGPAKSARSIPR